MSWFFLNSRLDGTDQISFLTASGGTDLPCCVAKVTPGCLKNEGMSKAVAKDAREILSHLWFGPRRPQACPIQLENLPLQP